MLTFLYPVLSFTPPTRSCWKMTFSPHRLESGLVLRVVVADYAIYFLSLCIIAYWLYLYPLYLLPPRYKYEALLTLAWEKSLCHSFWCSFSTAYSAPLSIYPLISHLYISSSQDAKRSRHHHVNVSWLRRTEYISTEPTRFQPQTNEKIEATVGFATRRKQQAVSRVIWCLSSSFSASFLNFFCLL